MQPPKPWPKPNPVKSATEKLKSLFVDDAEWPGLEAWLEKWRDVPWPEKKK